MTPSALAAAAATFALVATVSYALQHLAAVAFDPVPASSVLAQAHVPYFWRVGVSVLHGAGVAALVAVLPDPVPQRLLPHLQRLTPPLVGLCAAAMLALP